jgi:hypothetical protein
MGITLYCDGILIRGVCEGANIPTKYVYISDSNCPDCIEKKKKEKGKEKA